MLSTILIVLTATSAAAVPPHTVAVEHHGRTMQASYHGDVRVARKQVGAAVAPGKMGTTRCMWTAKIHVERRLSGADGSAALLPTRVGEPARLTGHHPGDCLTARRAIATQVAEADEDVRAHLRAVAAEDAPRLRAELDQARRYAAR